MISTLKSESSMRCPSENGVRGLRNVYLKINTKNPVMGGYALAVQLLKENRVLVDADVKLSRERPLFIRGPFVGQGQLIILLMVQ